MSCPVRTSQPEKWMCYCECAMGSGRLFNASKAVLSNPMLIPKAGQNIVHVLENNYQIELIEVWSIIRKLLSSDTIDRGFRCNLTYF
ncbi:hypothetical protein EG68_04778 [Paragonimus skrjabini miyazakii]|uniref:Uncharacterized protein n=1 Tax=Paragonimus skrjabini miyazakii TaxID=59628 RepID=A0A8S9Z534_9TREM|nr:hypothetical protein EG68_04778 [Paragonimus skrjabini miyazakii]